MIQKFFGKVLSKVFFLAANNVFINPVLVRLKKDNLPKIYLRQNDWALRKYQEDKTLQENVGCSHIIYIQNLVDDTHITFKRFVKENLKPGQSVFDIGCGTGLFLKDLEGMGLRLSGIDLNGPFLDKAKELVPDAALFKGSFFDKFETTEKYDLFACFSVLMYIEPSRLEEFFDKIHSLLNKDGLVFVQYAHALSKYDLLYPDITYVKYSPRKINKVVEGKFEIVKHEHFYYGHIADEYDKKRFYFPDGNKNRLDTIENSYLLILKKK